MKNQNKILISLLTASASALAAAPTFAEKLELENNQDKDNNNLKETIDIDNIINLQTSLTEEQIIVRNDIKAQIEAMLTKKAPIMKISEYVDIVVDNYGKNNESAKKQIFDELKLGGADCSPGSKSADSTCMVTTGGVPSNNRTNPSYGGSGYGGSPRIECHAACHNACHRACHGSRGWR